MKYLFFIVLFYSCFPVLQVKAQDKCNVLSEILDEQHISNLIASYENNNLIRVTDLSGYFGKMKCGHNKYSVRVKDKLMLDLNSGRFIDINILSYKEEGELLEFEVFYSQRTPKCKRDILMKGKVVFKKRQSKIIFIKSKFGSID